MAEREAPSKRSAVSKNPLAQQFGGNLRHHRLKAGMAQEKLSLGATMNRAEMSLLERGARLPRIDTLLKLASVLDVGPAVLLDGIEWKPGEPEGVQAGGSPSRHRWREGEWVLGGGGGDGR